MFRIWQRHCSDYTCKPWYRWQISRGMAFGELPARPEAFKVRCQWPAWEYIDPVKEAKGNAIAISTITKTPSECIRERGGEPSEVFAEYAEDLNRIRELGVKLPTVHLEVDESEGEDNSDKKPE